ncbi:MAG: hypothetical protein JW889_10665 [Verrucomicrobia bacterium]|nr:hypothetical protein [Verrucomicrobiota bacterium]
MSTVADILDRLDDRLNPIAVKELRQAVRTHGLLGMLGFVLVGELVVMVLALPGARETAPLEAGRHVFRYLYSALMIACAVFVPIYCGVRAAQDRAAASTGLLATMPLAARSIVAGKLLSGVVIALLIYSVSAPFLVFTYLLRGIGLDMVLWALLAGFLVSVLAIQAAIFVGSVRAHAALKGVLGLFAFPAMYYMAGWFWLGFELSADREWAVRLFVVALILAAVGHFFVWTMAVVSPTASNWALPIRLFVTVAWFVTGVLACVAGWTAVAIWGVLSTQSLCIALLVAVSEPARTSRRVLRSMPLGGLRRRVMFLLSTGPANGVAWACIMGVANAIVVACAGVRESWSVGAVLLSMTVLWVGVFGAAMTALIIRRSTTWGGFHQGRTGVLGAAIWLVTLPLILVMGPGPYVLLSLIWAVAVGAGNLEWFGECACSYSPGAIGFRRIPADGVQDLRRSWPPVSGYPSLGSPDRPPLPPGAPLVPPPVAPLPPRPRQSSMEEL